MAISVGPIDHSAAAGRGVDVCVTLVRYGAGSSLGAHTVADLKVQCDEAPKRYRVWWVAQATD